MTKKHFNILLADDDTEHCNSFKNALDELHIHDKLTIINDPKQLIPYLTIHSAQLPDVLFLDFTMDSKQTFQCFFEIKANEKLKHLLVVMYSSSNPDDANYERNLINMLYKYEALNYIKRPETFDQLKQRIQYTIVMIKNRIHLKEIVRASRKEMNQYSYYPNGQ